ncbi:MAG: (2Fe-2S) ferredoxin domain-containing protein [Mariprofundaceae bacterium]|nr:(2Fe-2S) ferredoxin domain-containing protein [Mariprofundaceae bacterium]
MSEKLVIAPYQRHAILCTGKSCGEQVGLLKFFKKRIEEEGLAQGDTSVRVNRAGCLGVCAQGPIMVVYPEGVWYSDLDEAKMEQIIQGHLKGGEVQQALAFHAQA